MNLGVKFLITIQLTARIRHFGYIVYIPKKSVEHFSFQDNTSKYTGTKKPATK